MTFASLDVVHLNMGQPLPELTAASADRGIYLVLWHGRRPIGHCRLAPAVLPMSSSALADIVSQATGPWYAHRMEGANAVDAQDTALADDRRDWSNLFQHPFIDNIDGQDVDEGATTRPANTWQSKGSDRREIANQGLDTEQKAGPIVSVVVCTRDRPDDLRRCLEHLQRCNPPADEVVVVDNASTSSETRDVVATFAGVHYVHEPRTGLDIARNSGARAAAGEIVAYTDDDVCVYPHWISSIRRAFEDPSVAALTGSVLPRQLETRAQWIFETEWGFNRGYCPQEFAAAYFRKHRGFGVPAWEVGAGANMSFRREVFDRVGYFDVRLDVGAAGCSGDSEYWYRIMAAGMKCRYDPSVVVQHLHRETMEELKRQLYAYMRGHTAALLVQFERHRHWGNLARLCCWLPLYYMKRIVSRAAFGPTDSFVSIGPEMLGCLSGVLFYLKSITLDRRRWNDAQGLPVSSPHLSTDGVLEVAPPSTHNKQRYADR